MAASTKKKKNPSWNEGDDHKLLALFNEHRANPNKGLDPNIEVTKPALEEIIQKYFPQIPYRNFRILWLKKTAQYNIDQTLHGANKSKPDDGKLSTCIA